MLMKTKPRVGRGCCIGYWLAGVIKTGVGRRDEVIAHCHHGKVMIHDMITEPLRDESGKITGVRCAATDITQRKRLEESLAKANEDLEQKVKDRTARLRNMSSEMAKSEQRERRRIAQILHDHLQQNLCAMKLRAGELKETSSEEAVIGLAERLLKELDDAIATTRTLTTDLYPPVLNHLGLKESMEWLADDMSDRLGLDVGVKVARGLSLASDEMHVFAFEAVRELLLNVAKHAKVKKAEVRVGAIGKRLGRIQVKDAGVGFDPKKKQLANGHYGLLRIQERAELFWGRCEVVSQPNKGTCVSILLPLG
jgi:signal transduction histidine kinase